MKKSGKYPLLHEFPRPYSLGLTENKFELAYRVKMKKMKARLKLLMAGAVGALILMVLEILYVIWCFWLNDFNPI